MGLGTPYEERIGQKFGKLTILTLGGFESGESNRRKRLCMCQCDCGKVVEIRIESVVSSRGAKSCGCARRNKGNSALSRTYGRYKNGAKQRGYDFLLGRIEFEQLLSDNCHYCGIKPSTVAEYNGHTFIYNGIDRVNNDEGYISDNVVTCCITCNRAKHDLSYNTFVEWIERLSQWQK